MGDLFSFLYRRFASVSNGIAASIRVQGIFPVLAASASSFRA